METETKKPDYTSPAILANVKINIRKGILLGSEEEKNQRSNGIERLTREDW